jgi:hypothetical protein
VDVDRFRRDGYVVADGLLDPALDLDPVVDEYTVLLDRLARRWHAEGRLGATYAHLPFGERLRRIVAESGIRYHQHLEISLPSRGVTEETPVHLGPAIFGLLTSPRLADAVEDLIGPEILSNPIQHTRIKCRRRPCRPTSATPSRRRRSGTRTRGSRCRRRTRRTCSRCGSP